MTGIFLFPVKPDNKEYQFYKEPRKALEIDDETVLSFKNTSKGVNYIIHYDNEWDGLSDEQIVEKWNEHCELGQVELSGRRSGLGYTTVDKKRFIRIIRK